MTINVAIADDHQVVINGLQHMLETALHIQVTDVYEGGNALLKGLCKQVPDVLLLDIQMPDMNGDELAGIISKKYPSVRIIAMTAFSMTYYVKTMLQKGAAGYLLKNTDKATLITAIETVYSGEQYIDASLKQQLLDDMLHNRKSATNAPTLTRREKDVLSLIMAECTSSQIAEKLFLSLRTVEHYRTNLMQKLNVKNTIGLVKIAIQMDLLK
jgi:DNA-binding NarL/FixJ family response regulator